VAANAASSSALSVFGEWSKVRAVKTARLVTSLFIVLPLASAVGCSSDDDSAEEGSSASGGTKGIVIAAGGTSPDNATDPDPIPPGNTNGWTDITDEEKGAFVGQACDGWSAEPEALPSILEFVLDVSGTMRAETDSTGGQSKWEVSADALQSALDELPAHISVGLTFYPNMDNGGSKDERLDHTPCIDHGDDVDPDLLGDADSAQRAALEDVLASIEPDERASTPTHDALDHAFEVLQGLGSNSARYAVLITDGQPTLAKGCFGAANPREPEDTDPIVEAIGEIYDQTGIRTFVVGSPGSESNEGTGADVRGWLSAAARAGGTATAGCSDDPGNFCHFDLTTASDFGDALSGALSSIGKAVIGCDYELPATAPNGDAIDPNQVNLIYTDQSGQAHLLLPNGAEDCSVGWRYLDPPEHTKIHVCGATCETIMNDPGASFDLVFGCATGEVPPVY
jgi:hypothetical protein